MSARQTSNLHRSNVQRLNVRTTSNVQRPKSNAQRQNGPTSNVIRPPCNVQRLMSQCPMSNVQHMKSNVKRTKANARRVASIGQCPNVRTSNVRTSIVQRPTSNVQRPMFDFKRSTSNVQRQTPNLQRPTSNIQCPHVQRSTSDV